jgi:hypothetical protein
MNDTTKSPSAPKAGLKRKSAALKALPLHAHRTGMPRSRRATKAALAAKALQEPAPAQGLMPAINMMVDGAPEETRIEPFETIRIFDLARLRAQLHRSVLSATRRGQDDYVSEKQPLLAILDRGHVELNAKWPDVVVMRRPKNGNLQTNFAVIGHVIYLGEHLSRHWLKGKLDEGFYRALRDALRIYVERQVSRFGALGGKTH